MKKILCTLLVVSLLSIVSCQKITSNNNNDNTSPKIGIRGVVMDIAPIEDGIQVLIEGEIEDDTDYDKAYVSLSSKTKIFKGQEEITLSPDEVINIGQTLEIDFDGAVAESYPVQGKALFVRIIQGVE